MVTKYIIIMLGRIIRIKLDVEDSRVSKLSILNIEILGNILIFFVFVFFFFGL